MSMTKREQYERVIEYVKGVQRDNLMKLEEYSQLEGIVWQLEHMKKENCGEQNI